MLLTLLVLTAGCLDGVLSEPSTPTVTPADTGSEAQYPPFGSIDAVGGGGDSVAVGETLSGGLDGLANFDSLDDTHLDDDVVLDPSTAGPDVDSAVPAGP